MLIRQSKKPIPATTVNAGVAKGMIMLGTRVAHNYPEAARHARLQDTIVFEAVITKQANIESLKTSKGPFVLIEAAYDAVSQWKYRPYLLNREPVEWLTVIEVTVPAARIERL